MILPIATEAEVADPRLGMRVEFTRDDHPIVPPGRRGFIELLELPPGNQFFVLLDCGGFFGWTDFRSWRPTGEPDEVLDEAFLALRRPG
jgi:hypothetical protein